MTNERDDWLKWALVDRVNDLRAALEVAREEILRLHGCYPLPSTKGRAEIEQIDAALLKPTNRPLDNSRARVYY